MWRLTVHQLKDIEVNGETLSMENEVSFEDENPDNLMDLVRYFSELQVPNKTWYTLESDESDMKTTIIDKGGK